MKGAGRICPVDYRYPPSAFAREAEFRADTAYVVGGLYGNRPALDTIERLVAKEPGEVSVVFNGDFHWFDATPERFEDIDRRVSEHRALRGNVETELARSGDIGAGCGCAYPDSVDNGTVERSNLILVRLRQCVDVLPGTRERLAHLPMMLTAYVGGLRIGIVHGDAESLSGWRFSIDALDLPTSRRWLEEVRSASRIDMFASSHTCLPALRDFSLDSGRLTVINNGTAGMPNFRGEHYGVLTRIGVRSSPHPTLYGIKRDGVFVEALPVPYDQRQWLREFVDDWPPGSPAYDSYYSRITDGPQLLLNEAVRGLSQESVAYRR
jgi:hypothetical protein